MYFRCCSLSKTLSLSLSISMKSQLVFSVILLLCSASIPIISVADPVEDKQALLDFISKIQHGRDLNWREETSVCSNWTGVTCSSNGSRVIALRLPGIGFNGDIPPNTLGRLSALQIVSLRSNGLTGSFPADFVNLTALTGLHLQLNSFSGPLPGDFSPWKNLTVLDLSFNRFNQSIPLSISNMTQLVALNLSNNSLTGEIPDLYFPNLQLLNLSNNRLNGSIPATLQNFPNSSFSGNNLSPVLPIIPSSPILGKKLSESVILGIVIGGCALLFIFIAISMVIFYSWGRSESAVSGKPGKGDVSPEKAATGSRDENNRLVFFEGCTFAFDLEDLLRASAEVLGKGTFGTAYKAILEDSTNVVVKRLKEVGVGKREFEQQMEVVGRVKHENVAELRAYYYSKDEKLLVYDYYSEGSVFSLLHGMKGKEKPSVDWETRVRIALGAARGIARVHAESNGKLVHGNVKSSNVFLNRHGYGCISDLGLNPLMNQPHVARTAGYRAPEVVDIRRASQPSDVYGFGVFVLELLTGKSPVAVSGSGEEVVHLVRWVQSVVREEWTAEVFDVELMRYPNIEEEMVEMLQVAMVCVARMPEQRPKMADVAKMIENLGRLDGGSRPSAEANSGKSSGLTTPQ